VPNLLRSKLATNEASAVGSVRTINSAEVTYQSAYPDNGFSPDLTSLGGAAPCVAAVPAAACLIDDALAQGTKTGYTFTVVGSAGAGNPINTNYTVNAVPVTPGVTGQRNFFSDESGVIRYEVNGAATVNSAPLS
jgi:hypothetical protein